MLLRKRVEEYETELRGVARQLTLTLQDKRDKEIQVHTSTIGRDSSHSHSRTRGTRKLRYTTVPEGGQTFCYLLSNFEIQQVVLYCRYGIYRIQLGSTKFDKLPS